MVTALVLLTAGPDGSGLVADLEAAGVHVLGAPGRDKLVRDASRLGPELVVVREASLDAALLDLCRLMMTTAPCPIVVFTSDPDVDKMALAMAAGVAAYVVNGYEPQRLRSVLQVARTRYAAEQALRLELAELKHRFEERKLVDKAKGILMRARQLSEDEAFRVLRTASMHSHRRVGQVSQQVIDAARYAEAVNRAGQLRALSQRLVKLYVLRMRDIEPLLSARLMAESITRIETIIDGLGKSVSASTFGDLIQGAVEGWAALKSAVLVPAVATRLMEVDGLAEQLLKKAEQLTTNLQGAGLVTTLQVINVSGRQRMLSQRYAKLHLMMPSLPGPVARLAAQEAASVASTFEETLVYLNDLPLTTTQTRDLLAAASASWQALDDACRQGAGAETQWLVGTTSEALLTISQELTDAYERSMQVLMG